MMIATVASLLRALNSRLLYSRGLLNYVLKVPYLASTWLFKVWIRKRRPGVLMTIDNYDSNLKIQIDISKTMGASLFWTGFHEFKELRFLHDYLRETMTFVDVGANQGEFALFAAKRVPGGRVLAFEPMSAFFQRLISNVRLNGMTNITSYQIGLSDHAEEVPLYFEDDTSSEHEGLASLYQADSGARMREIVRLERLDDLVARDSLGKIDFMKVDVEGAEWPVLRGSQQLLKRDRPALMIELNDITTGAAGYTVEEMIAWLADLGYRPYRIVKRGLEPLMRRPAFCNAVFLPAKD